MHQTGSEDGRQRSLARLLGHGRPTRTSTIDIYTEHGNFFPLAIAPTPRTVYQLTHSVRGRARERIYLSWQEPGLEVTASPTLLERALKRLIVDACRGAALKISKGEDLIFDTRHQERERRAPFLVPLPAYRMRVMAIGGAFFLCLDHHLVLKNADNLNRLRRVEPSLALHPNQRVHVRDHANSSWAEGRFVSESDGLCHIVVLDDEGNELMVVVPPELVLPDLARDAIARLAERTGAGAADLERRLKERALLTVSQPAEARLQLAVDFAAYLTELCFPAHEGGFTLTLDATPARLAPPQFDLRRDLTDPRVAFDREDASRRSGSILEGLSRYGSYDKPGRAIRLAVIAPPQHIVPMRALVERINRGGDRYQGAASTFGAPFEVAIEMGGDELTGYDAAIRELVRQPEAAALDVVLTYLPKGDHITDPGHPYFIAKKLLLHEGLPSQMVDTATLFNPRWKDLNLALNVFAKAGHTPWVLDEGIDEVDLFIGLSYSTSPTVRFGDGRMMAWVNVFDRYGRWRLYESDMAAFPFSDRLRHLGVVVANSIAAYRAKAPGERLRTIHIQYTKKFGRDERRAVTSAIQREVPDARIAFVSINMYHPVRLFDLDADHEGVIDRATYLTVGPKRLYLATTGSNPWAFKGMGTPVPLELTVWSEPWEYQPSLSSIAQTVLALTRLNWASTRPFAREPITTKYAGQIAYALGIFIDDPSFKLNPRLRDRPWFL